MLTFEKKSCLICESPVHGRRDKKFCSDNCRAIFHQNQKQLIDPLVHNINRVLRTNWRILITFLSQSNSFVSLDHFLRSGFQPVYHTHLSTDNQGEMVYCCYDMGWKLNQNQNMVVVLKID